MRIALFLLSILVLHVLVNCQCGPIGTSNEREFTAVRDHRLYLNTEYPAPCSGTVDRVTHCYYRPATVMNDERYRVTWAVYRRVGSVGRRGDRSPLNANDGNFWCREVNVNDFRIVAGDIVGACIYDPVDNSNVRKQLDIVGQANGYSLMQMNDVSACSDNSMPSNISSSQLSTTGSKILHLYATITDPTYIPPPTTTMSTTEQTTAVTWITATPSTSDITTAPPTTTSKFQTSDAMTWNTMILTSDTTSDNIPNDETPSSTAYLITTLPSAESQTTTANLSTTALPSQTPSSTMATTESTPITTDLKGNQAARVIIAVGSAGGGLLVLLFITMVAIIAAIVCLMLKRKVHNLSANIEYNTKTSTEEYNIYNIVTNTNASYKQTATLDAKLEVLYDTTNPVEGTTGLQESTDWDSKLNMEENVVYESSTAAQISLTSNAAYCKSGKSLKEIDQAKDCNDQYDYIYI